jgi:hypothetical protein
MFVELMPLLAGRTVLVTVARVDDKTLRVNVIPYGKADDNPALSTPLKATPLCPLHRGPPGGVWGSKGDSGSLESAYSSLPGTPSRTQLHGKGSRPAIPLSLNMMSKSDQTIRSYPLIKILRSRLKGGKSFSC